MRKYFASALALALSCAAFSGAAFAGPGGGGKSDEDPGKSANAPGQEKKAESTPAAQTAAPGQQKKAAATTSASTKGKSANAPGQQKKAAVQTQNQPGTRGNSALARTHVIICHRTGSNTNPYVVINISKAAWVQGHRRHPALGNPERNDILLAEDVAPGTKGGFTKANCVPPAPPPTIEAVTTTAAVTTTEAVTTEAAVLGVAAEIRREAAQKPAKGKAKGRGGVLGAAAELRAVGERELPFTGIPLWIAALVALVLLSTGIGLRRATR